MQDITVVDLMNIKQGKEETLKTFMDRYQKTIRQVKGLRLELTLQYIMPTLRPGPFKDSVCRTPPKTMEELRERAIDEVRVEDMKQSYKREMQEAKGEMTDVKKSDGQTRRPGGTRTREGSRGPKFQQYTPLNAPQAQILQEALSAQLLQTP